MSITKEKKQEIIKEFSRSGGDTGSVEVQVAIATSRINNLTGHFKANNQKDYQSKRGLLMLVNQRRKLLKYLQNSDQERYQVLIQKLGLRK